MPLVSYKKDDNEEENQLKYPVMEGSDDEELLCQRNRFRALT